MSYWLQRQLIKSSYFLGFSVWEKNIDRIIGSSSEDYVQLYHNSMTLKDFDNIRKNLIPSYVKSVVKK